MTLSLPCYVFVFFIEKGLRRIDWERISSCAWFSAGDCVSGVRVELAEWLGVKDLAASSRDQLRGDQQVYHFGSEAFFQRLERCLEQDERIWMLASGGVG